MIKLAKIFIIMLTFFTLPGCFYLELEFDFIDGIPGPPPVPGGPTAPLTPGIQTALLSSDNLTLQLTFTEPVYEEDDGEGALLVSDFELLFNSNGGGATNVTIASISHLEGSATVTLTLAITGTPTGVEQIEVRPSSNIAIYTASGSGLETTISSGPLTLSAPFLGGYTIRREISIDHTRVPANFDLSNFPVMLTLSGEYLQTTGSGGSITSVEGYDIQFTGPDGTTGYAHQIESYDGVKGELVAWVRVPTIFKEAPTNFYLYYGNSSVVSNSENAPLVWSKYRSVWHMNELSGGAGAIKNAVSPLYNGTDMGGLSLGEQGVAGGAAGFDGVDDYITLGSVTMLDGTNPFSISLWTKVDGLPGANNQYTIWDRKTAAHENVLSLVIGDYAADGDGRLCFYTSDESFNFYNHFSNAALVGGNWTHVAMVYDGVDICFFINGVLDSKQPFAPPEEDEDFAQDIGRSRAAEYFYYKGLMDELRFSENTLSPSWIATEYSNQSSPATFFSIGAEEKK